MENRTVSEARRRIPVLSSIATVYSVDLTGIRLALNVAVTWSTPDDRASHPRTRWDAPKRS